MSVDLLPDPVGNMVNLGLTFLLGEVRVRHEEITMDLTVSAQTDTTRRGAWQPWILDTYLVRRLARRGRDGERPMCSRKIPVCERSANVYCVGGDAADTRRDLIQHTSCEFRTARIR